MWVAVLGEHPKGKGRQSADHTISIPKLDCGDDAAFHSKVSSSLLLLFLRVT